MRVRLGIMVLCVAVFSIGFAWLQASSPESERGIFSMTPPTPYVRFQPDGDPLGTVLVLHGLNANKELMKPAAMAMADAGFEVYAVDLPGHGNSGAVLSFDDSVSVARQTIALLGEDTIAVGHSMGGAVLTELAASTRLRTLVLYSPAPIPVEAAHADRMLVVSGRLEPPLINRHIPRLRDVAGSRGSWWRYPWGSHSTALFQPDQLEAAIQWMGGRHETVRAEQRRAGLALMMAAALSLGFAVPVARARPDPARRPDPPLSRILIVQYLAAGFAAIVVLRFIQPLAWLRVFATDYMMSAVLVTGLLLWRGRSFSLSGRGLAVAVIAAAYVIGVPGLLVASHFGDLTPQDGQWYRLPVLTIAALPLFLYDEENVRRIPLWWKRWSTFLVTRSLVWATVVSGSLLLNRTAGFLVLIMHFVLLFWLLLWWLTAFVARKTGEPAAAALFAALVQGWAFAAIFVRI